MWLHTSRRDLRDMTRGAAPYVPTAEMWGGVLRASSSSVICYEGQNVCSDTDVAFTLQAGRPDQQHIPTVVYDARGNGGTVPTMTGHHNANISDYTALIVERNDE